jgi:hypothetical protein
MAVFLFWLAACLRRARQSRLQDADRLREIAWACGTDFARNACTRFCHDVKILRESAGARPAIVIAAICGTARELRTDTDMRPSIARKIAALSPLLLLGFACASSPNRVDPEEMSAQAHRDEAQKEQAEANADQASFNPAAAQPSPFRDRGGEGDSLSGIPIYNPTEGHLRESDWHRQHARAHQIAAEKLERFEASACDGIPAKERAACPLLIRVTQIEDIDGGVRVTFKGGTDLTPILKNMQCQHAYARTHGFADDSDACPLYMGGLDIRQANNQTAIELTANLPKTIEAVRKNIRAQAIFARP